MPEEHLRWANPLGPATDHAPLAPRPVHPNRNEVQNRFPRGGVMTLLCNPLPQRLLTVQVTRASNWCERREVFASEVHGLVMSQALLPLTPNVVAQVNGWIAG